MEGWILEIFLFPSFEKGGTKAHSHTFHIRYFYQSPALYAGELIKVADMERMTVGLGLPDSVSSFVVKTLEIFFVIE
ncbi:hypothetical protein PsorP6_003126 [Peronosclerospora sorghi]|uniref:Uncharacterized protein n=1 Tax=Peronosclerospora sorghi TaxID=230839 RepID=A0ACC0VLG9_9STRA|nr:hypothetical protein PsorP6_003126 [Peronosclerospora sorghi]